MTAWYDKAIFYHMYPLGMTGAPFANPYPVSDGTADGTRDVSSDSRMDELSPISNPILNFIKHRTINPTIVVRLLAKMEFNASLIALLNAVI